MDEKYKGSGTRIYFIPEYYDYSSVQKLIKGGAVRQRGKAPGSRAV